MPVFEPVTPEPNALFMLCIAETAFPSLSMMQKYVVFADFCWPCTNGIFDDIDMSIVAALLDAWSLQRSSPTFVSVNRGSVP